LLSLRGIWNKPRWRHHRISEFSSVSLKHEMERQAMPHRLVISAGSRSETSGVESIP
jgi:hypothetical protein